MLLEKISDVNFAFEENGKTPLIFASSNADTYVNSVEHILNYKADVFLTDKHGKNGLIFGFKFMVLYKSQILLNLDFFYL
jgi:ankyrin repeat protein